MKEKKLTMNKKEKWQSNAPVTTALRYSICVSPTDKQAQLERQTGDTRDFIHGEGGGTLRMVQIADSPDGGTWFSQISCIHAY